MAEERGPIATLGTYESESSPGKFYEVRVGGDGVTYCTCRGWIQSKNKMSSLGKSADEATCKHKQAYMRGEVS